MGLRADPLVRRGALVAIALCLVGCPPIKRDDGSRPSALIDPALVARLDAQLASERAKAAFELGQLGVAWDPVQPEIQHEAERRLCERLERERDDAARVEIIAALGRVGGERARRSLLAELDRPGSARPRAGWALAALYRRRRDQMDVSADVVALGRALIAPEAEVRAAVVDALAESKREGARSLLVRELGDADALARARAARGLIGLAAHEDIESLERVLADADERAAAGAADALATLGEKGDAAAIAALQHSVEQIAARPAVLLSLSQLGLRRADLAPVFAAAERATVGKGRVQCIAAVSHDRATARIQRVRTCGGDAISQRERDRLVAEVLGSCDPALSLGAVDTLLGLPKDDAALRADVVSALGHYDDPRARPRVIAALDDPDGLVRASAAEVAAEHGWNEAGPAIVRALPAVGTPAPLDELDSLLSFVATAGVLRPAGAAERLRALLDGTPAALALAAREALAKIGDRPGRIHPVHPNGPYDTLAVDGPVRVRLETSRGPIVLELDLQRAPKNARNFLGLVRKGFYDGLKLHRVVPGFVIQGGDPLGNGSGGAGHLVACEPNNAAYVEGTVGMALSGPDTGSSQFFIALAPAPHLEGRYTAFGRVLSGMDVARAILPDDVIRTAREER